MFSWLFNFKKFYQRELRKGPYELLDEFWAQFLNGERLKFKSQTLQLLKENAENRNQKGLSVVLGILFRDGVDKDYTGTLLALLDEDWHISEEDIVSLLQEIKDPKSVDKLYEVAVNVPDYDEMRALAKKCMWALVAINTPESIEKIKQLQKIDDPIIKENATFHLGYIAERSVKNAAG